MKPRTQTPRPGRGKRHRRLGHPAFMGFMDRHFADKIEAINIQYF